MDLFEYQARDLLASHGVPVLPGGVAETPEHMLDDDTTPFEKFYVRNNGQTPEPFTEGDAWELTIDGEVNTPLTWRVRNGGSRLEPTMKRTLMLLAALGGVSALAGCVVAPVQPVPVGVSATYHHGPGPAPRAYRDRDGDGVPNRYDRRPRDPYRY